MKSSAASSAMAGLIHPGIAYTALQQNTTVTRNLAPPTWVQRNKKQAKHRG
jgi:hypothetical protein